MGIITDILKEIPLSAVLRERLADQEIKMATLEAENAALKSENTVLKSKFESSQKDNEELRRKIKEYEQVTKQLPNGPRTKRGDFM
jgi:septal ring factor EnvC (AmiA/AmiB activator)